MDAQFAFAQAAFAAGRRDEAADTLLQMIGAEREWNEGAAKAKLLQIFEAIGLEDPWVAAQRRRLSLLLFGYDGGASASRSSRCPARSCFPGCNCRCISSSRAIARWSATRWRATGGSR